MLTTMNPATRRTIQLRALGNTLTVEQYQRLRWFKATYAAGAHLASHGLGDDPAAARRLAFGLWLKASGRLDGEFTLAPNG